MRWKHRPNPQSGDKRVVRRFAWLPVTSYNHDVVLWLERYKSLEIYQGYLGYWVNMEVTPIDKPPNAESAPRRSPNPPKAEVRSPDDN